MNNQQVLKEGSAQNTPPKQNLKRKDPRQDTEIDVISSDNEDKINQKDAITDLDIAYSIIFDEMKKEYMRERERGRDKRDGDRAAIPQRVFQSFLVSVENDINEYSSNVNYHKRLLREERKLKSSIEDDRKELIRQKRDNASIKSKLVVLRKQHAQLKKKHSALKNADIVTEKVRRVLQSQSLEFSIPTIPVNQQINSYDLLQSLNESIENKINTIKKRNRQN